MLSSSPRIDGIEDLDAVGAGALGAQHGKLAFAQHVLRRLLAVMHDDADRGGEDDLLGADLHRRAERAPDPLGERRHVMRVALGDEQDGELVAAEPRERVLRVEMTAEPPAEREQHAVADHQAEALVHVLEAVDVDEDDGGAVGLTFARRG